MRQEMEFYPFLVRKVGIVPAIVLSKILYWNQGRLRVKRKGALWLAKSRAEMCEETGLSLYQQKRAISFLKHNGWIIIEHGLFKNKRVPFIQLTKKGRALLEEMKSVHQNGPNSVHPDGADSVHPDGPNSVHCNTVIHSTENTTSPTALGDFVAKGSKKLEKNSEQGKNKCPSPHCAAPPSTDLKMDSQQTLAKLKAKKAVPAEGPKNAAGLAMAWQKLVPYYHDLPVLAGGLKVKPLTQKEVGMLAKYLKAVGREEAYAVMHWSIQNWYLLSISVKEMKGGTLPTIPGVNLLLRYYDIAVGCYKKSQQAPAKVNSGVKVMSEAEQKLKLLVGK